MGIAKSTMQYSGHNKHNQYVKCQLGSNLSSKLAKFY